MLLLTFRFEKRSRPVFTQDSAVNTVTASLEDENETINWRRGNFWEIKRGFLK